MTEARIITRSTNDGTIAHSYEFTAINLCEASIRAQFMSYTEIVIRIDGKVVRTISKTERAALALKDRDTAYEIRDEINAFVSKLVDGKEYLETRWQKMTAVQREGAKAEWIIPGIRGGSILATLNRISGTWRITSTVQITHATDGTDLPLVGMRPWGLPTTKEAREARLAKAA
ncbi:MULTISPECIES: hypothetical protein [unclassified Rhizobium]|uniref:hypothetical protein n=1 Tax=unclassified Rhizobium TaxID=2613769 RepID=UPI0007EBC456|nr:MULTISPECIES: hypothetical protein [unclassified Rhizobium]ANL12039.1 hypothetical protein AMJ98_PA00093 [Rhizobium sp. N1341]ANM42884.1 hypothetical protein AMK03_PA00093 [Rhizobium sp. N741]